MTKKKIHQSEKDSQIIGKIRKVKKFWDQSEKATHANS